jgi:RNA polymerase sigma-70 factor (ECF subfamily)
MAVSEDVVARVLTQEHRKLAAYTWSLVRDNHMVDDILQEVATVAIRKRGDLNDETHLLAWLRVTCRRTALDALKRRGQRPALLGDAALDLLDLEWQDRQRHDSADLLSALEACLKKLTNYSQNLINMRYKQGLSAAQIAKQLGRKPASMRVIISRLHRALGDCIRQRLAREAEHEG